MYLHRKLAVTGQYPPTFIYILSCMVLSFILFVSPAAAAETMYVKPSAEIPIRSGRGTEYKILSVVPDGLQVELLEEEENWARVRTEGGTEGWMLKRYLSVDKPLADVVAALTAQKEQLVDRLESTQAKYTELSEVHSQTEQELNGCIREREECGEKYLTLQEDTADVIRTKEELAAATSQLETVSQQLAVLEQENRKLLRSKSLKWFALGALVLFVGWLIGMMSRRSGKRRSSLY